jgi:hypothetical protein
LKYAGILFDEEGEMSEDRVRRVMGEMGFEDMKSKEMKIVIQSFDNDGDGGSPGGIFRMLLLELFRNRIRISDA